MSIQGYAEAIGEGVVTDPQAAAAIIQEESAKMKQLVDDILTLARVEDFQQALEVEDLSLSDLLYDVSWRLKPKADSAGLSSFMIFKAQKTRFKRMRLCWSAPSPIFSTMPCVLPKRPSP